MDRVTWKATAHGVTESDTTERLTPMVLPLGKTSPSQCRGLGLIPGQVTKSHMPQLKARILQLKIWSAKTKTQLSQIKKVFKLIK